MKTKSSHYIILFSVFLCLTATVAIFPIIISNSGKQNSKDLESDVLYESFSAEGQDTPASEEILSVIEEASSVKAEATPATQKRIAPKPKNYVKPLEKEEKAQARTTYEKPETVTPTKLIDVPYINQLSRYPSGCESVSAVMALEFAGYRISADSFIDNYLDKAVTPYIGTDGSYYGFDPNEYFLGDPYSKNGWGCKAPVIVKALNRCVDPNKHSVENITGASLSVLRSYIDRNIPVIIWATQGMEKNRVSKTWTIVGTDKKYTWTAPNHCLLLVGYDETGYYFNDPLTHKNCRYPADITENRYNTMGRQAIVITEKPRDESDEENTDGRSEVDGAGENVIPQTSGDNQSSGSAGETDTGSEESEPAEDENTP